MRLDTARPGWFPPGDDSDEGTGTQATNTRTAAEQPDVRRPPVAEARRRPAVDLRCPPNAADSRPHDACAVTRTAARSGPRPTAGRQRDPRHTTELRHPRGHHTVREAVKKACKTTDQPHLTPHRPRTSPKRRGRSHRQLTPGRARPRPPACPPSPPSPAPTASATARRSPPPPCR